MKKALIFLLFFVSIIIPYKAFAVSFLWDSNFNIPWVEGKWKFLDRDINWESLWSVVDYSILSEQFSSAAWHLCTSHAFWDDCNVMIVQSQLFFRIDLNWNYSSEQNLEMTNAWNIESGDYNGILKFFLTDKNEKDLPSDNIYVKYRFSSWKTGILYEFSKNSKCWKEDTNICVLWLTNYFTFVAPTTTRGIYWTFSDITLYNDSKNEARMYRFRLDKKEGNEDWIFKSLLQKIPWEDNPFNNWWYWARVGDLKEGNVIFSYHLPWTKIWKYWYLEAPLVTPSYFKVENKEMDRAFLYPMFTSSWFHKNLVLSSHKAYTKLQDQLVLLNDFLWGKDNSNIVYTLKDVFWFDSISYDERKWVSSDPDNFPGSGKCGQWDWVCSISKGISWGFDLIFKPIISFFDWIKGWLTDFTNWIKWLFESGKNIFDAVKEVFSRLWDLMMWILTIDDQKLFWATNRVICNPDWTFSFRDKVWLQEYEMENLRKEKIFLDSIISFFSLLNPFPPSENSKICTYSGLKEIHYAKNGAVDYLITFVFSVATFYFLLRKRN